MYSLSKRPLLSAAAFAGAALALSRTARIGRRMDFRGASVLISGGSRGLGLEIARLFADEGARLTLLARDENELEGARREIAARGAEVTIRRCDVGNREEAEAAVRAVVEEHGRIDVIVNNAGVIQAGPFENMDYRDFKEAMDVHAWGPLHLIKSVSPFMKRQGGGRIVNIASIGGLVAVPHLLPYCMSKFALVGLSDGVRAELAKDGIRVTTVAPGLMRTGSHVNAFFKGKHRIEFAWFAISDASPLLSTRSDKAARRIVKACRYGDSHLIITPQAKILHAVNALLPGVYAAGTKIAVRLLPGPADDFKERRSGWESRSAVAPSFLTRPADKVIGRNREGQSKLE